MRTTIEFPPGLLRSAKARSAERGESLKALVSRALAAELGREVPTGAARSRLVLPLFGVAHGERPNPSNADLERALAEADAHQVPKPRLAARRRSTRR